MGAAAVGRAGLPRGRGRPAGERLQRSERGPHAAHRQRRRAWRRAAWASRSARRFGGRARRLTELHLRPQLAPGARGRGGGRASCPTSSRTATRTSTTSSPACETFIERTDTRLVAFYRLNTSRARGGGQAGGDGRPNTRFDVQLSQGLPFLGDLTRADWELLLAVRNLFYETSEGGHARRDGRPEPADARAGRDLGPLLTYGTGLPDCGEPGAAGSLNSEAPTSLALFSRAGFRSKTMDSAIRRIGFDASNEDREPLLAHVRVRCRASADTIAHGIRIALEWRVALDEDRDPKNVGRPRGRPAAGDLWASTTSSSRRPGR